MAINEELNISPEEEMVPAYSPTYEEVMIPKRKASQYERRGYLLRDVQEISQEKERKEFDNPWAAAAAAFPRGASFGVSDQALTKTGAVEPRTLRGLKEHNPISSFVGEAAGLAAPWIFPPLRLFQTYGPLSLMMKAGGKTGQLVEKGLKASGYAVPKVAQSTLTGAARLGTEGSLYGIGSLVSDNALGNAEFNAENLMSYMGSGALFGGAFGATFGAGKHIAPLVGKKTAEVLSPVGKKVSDYALKGFAKASSFIGSGDEKQIRRLMKNLFTKKGYNNRKSILSYEKDRDKISREIAEDIERVEKMLSTTQSKVGKYRAAEREVLAREVDPVKAFSVVEDVAKELREVYKAFRKQPRIFSRTIVHDFSNIFNDFYKKASAIGSKTDVNPLRKNFEYYELLDDTKRQLQKLNKYDKGKFNNARELKTIEQLREVTSSLRNKLEDPMMWGELGNRQRELNNAFTQAYNAHKLFLKTYGEVSAVTGKKVFKPSSIHTYAIRKDGQIADQANAIFDNFLKSVFDLSDVIANPSPHVLNLVKKHPDLEKIITDQSIQYIRQILVNSRILKKRLDRKLGTIRDIRQLGWHSDMRQEGILGPISKASALGYFIDHTKLGAALGFVWGTLTKPAQTIKTLAFLESQFFETESFVHKSLRSFLRTKDFVAKVLPPRPINQRILFKSLLPKDEPIDEKPLEKNVKTSHPEKAKAMYKRQDEISYLLNNPDRLIELISRNIEELEEAHPDTAIMLGYKMSNCLQYLNSVIPRDPREQTLRGIQTNYVPTNSEMARVEKAFEIFDNPLSILVDLQQGTMTLEKATALANMYPEIYNLIADTLIVEMTDLPDDINRSKMTQLSAFLGQPLTTTLAPDLLNLIQSTYNQGNAAQPNSESLTPPAKIRAGQLAKSNLGGAYSTDLNQSVGGA